ncbi:MAG: hypothetical protein A3G02_00445 [Candidatus Yanofskybacteria bacterium RIFCSPLOWO2_12_FULL_44_13b]|uniref:Uncharacterized protein n=2 Tax=Candidatus Yanofskyibacteriota TaxID=1752733 RepID=A0A1F8H0M3_9BACT|nr:MAG: hypothetical protein A3C01_00340 [Candidatus Yanofskybacteria bacterium RIFCSPHIGHO2_02_FULL_44_36b]OGN18195.1 MAG: hypothetical protein A3F50_02395 [Candidatus Yanofskybacteria bacterium RIFCSPHIGHO2_12_FULL_44_29b]OGN30810.1 MAG: hypothetical protein A3I96_03185 [Candidatus Yanofskybacteria bacterium RIFCSPLOWO2_02_FULL_44_18]OGN34931.1 MAG: hypothetical protein A3G02_00445 [Candidatus Yanofskybacteria bacterium RIFCSPLOWO2_12_FULL_44_13b]
MEPQVYWPYVATGLLVATLSAIVVAITVCFRASRYHREWKSESRFAAMFVNQAQVSLVLKQLAVRFDDLCKKEIRLQQDDVVLEVRLEEMEEDIRRFKARVIATKNAFWEARSAAQNHGFTVLYWQDYVNLSEPKN